MRSPWQTLRDGGVPLVIEGSGTTPTAAELAGAALTAIALAPGGREAAIEHLARVL